MACDGEGQKEIRHELDSERRKAKRTQRDGSGNAARDRRDPRALARGGAIVKRALLAGLFLVTGCASPRAPAITPTQAALDRPSVRSVQAHVSHFDVFARFFAEDYAHFKSEARASNSTRGQDGWTVSTGTS